MTHHDREVYYADVKGKVLQASNEALSSVALISGLLEIAKAIDRVADQMERYNNARQQRELEECCST